MRPRPVLIKCPTWDHVEALDSLDLGPDGNLVVRLPFHPRPGEPIALSLELPDQEIVAIDAEVIDASPAADGKRSAVRLHLAETGALGRLAMLVAGARGQLDLAPRAEGSLTRAEIDRLSVPPPLPTDAPMDERIDTPELPTRDQVEGRGQAMFEQLERELFLMRGAPAHQVLGVAWDADVVEIRRAYFALTRRLHPDAVARYRSPALHRMASEVFVLVNRAYDRMRDAAVAGGRAIAAGPDLLPHRGWMAGVDDLGEPAIDAAVPLTPEDLGPGLADARASITRGEWEQARQLLLESLRRDPRDRSARALYHLASAEALVAGGKLVEARTQLQVALAHDPELAEARDALQRIGRAGEPG